YDLYDPGEDTPWRREELQAMDRVHGEGSLPPPTHEHGHVRSRGGRVHPASQSLLGTRRPAESVYDLRFRIGFVVGTGVPHLRDHRDPDAAGPGHVRDGR